MINFTKLSSLALGLALVGGLGLSTVASASTVPSHQVVAQDGSDRLQQNRVAADGSDRLKGNQVAEYGSERLQQNRVAADGSDRLKGNQVAEYGSEKLNNNRVTQVSPSNAVVGGVLVADNRAEFGSKYQRY